MDASLEGKIVVGQRRFTSEHRTVGGMEEQSDGFQEKQKDGRSYGSWMIFLAFGDY